MAKRQRNLTGFQVEKILKIVWTAWTFTVNLYSVSFSKESTWDLSSECSVDLRNPISAPVRPIDKISIDHSQTLYITQ